MSCDGPALPKHRYRLARSLREVWPQDVVPIGNGNLYEVRPEGGTFVYVTHPSSGSTSSGGALE